MIDFSVLIIISFIVGYFAGCIQVPYFVLKAIKGQDIREHGTGNAGASNVTVLLGWKIGILTAIGDILKSFIPGFAFKLAYAGQLNETELSTLIVMSGCGAIIGHIFPFFLSFNGGKGIACYIGMLLAINFTFGLITILLLILCTYITNFVSIGSILIYIVMPALFNYSKYPFEFLQIEQSGMVFLYVIGVVGLIKHFINIERIITKKEKGLSDVRNKKT
tara:strand:+ start:869 stop:1528 length:660 start_codon:yes stop_codon:yes gene_type:complete